MNKEKLTEILRKGGVKPVSRETVAGQDLYIGDGFSLPPHAKYARFGIDPMDFPKGMYVTWWWLGKDEKLDTGQPLFFDVHHNPEYSWSDKQISRVNTAVKTAREFIKTRNKHVTKH